MPPLDPRVSRDETIDTNAPPVVIVEDDPTGRQDERRDDPPLERRRTRERDEEVPRGRTDRGIPDDDEEPGRRERPRVLRGEIERSVRRLTRQRGEAERERDAAVQENRRLRQQLRDVGGASLDGAIEANKRRVEAAREAYAVAVEGGDPKSIADANLEVGRATSEEAALAIRRQSIKAETDAADDQAGDRRDERRRGEDDEQPLVKQRFTPRTQDWVDRNSWYLKDRDLRAAASNYAASLERTGKALPDTKPYFEAIDRFMAENYAEELREHGHEVEEPEVDEDEQDQRQELRRDRSETPVRQTQLRQRRNGTGGNGPLAMKPTEADREGARILGVDIDDYMLGTLLRDKKIDQDQYSKKLRELHAFKARRAAR